jgi:hypothetical protein
MRTLVWCPQIILLSFTTLRIVERYVANANVVRSNLIGYGQPFSDFTRKVQASLNGVDTLEYTVMIPETIPETIPEPASLSLLALGGISLLRRRRKA